MRFLKILLILLVAGVLCWYFLLRKHHHQITFNTPLPPGLVALQVADWNQFSEADIDSIVVLDANFEALTQRVYYQDSISTYQWFFSSVTDTTTQVKVWVTDEQHPFQQKLETPFIQNDFKARNIQNVSAVADILKETKKAFRVTPVSEVILPETHHSYISLNAQVDQKANVMVRNIYKIMDFINENDLELTDDPFSEITEWDREQHTINFRFSFPLKENAQLPNNGEVQFQNLPEQKALHLTFQGNYRISHMAWYYLLNYAERHGYKHTGKPIEFYRNDPHVTSGDPLAWKADIYLPLVE